MLVVENKIGKKRTLKFINMLPGWTRILVDSHLFHVYSSKFEDPSTYTPEKKLLENVAQGPQIQ